MARQPGARTQLAFAFETVYGTPPASGYRRMPFATTTLGSEQGLLSPELLGYGRDPQAPIRDASMWTAMSSFRWMPRPSASG